MNLDDLKAKKILIVSHTFVKGASQELEDFLVRNRTAIVLFIGHPLGYSKDKRSFFQQYTGGNLIVRGEAKDYNLPEIFLYVKDVSYTIYWVFKSRLKFDLLIGVDNLNAFSCLMLKWLGRGKKVVYYTIDYVPRRFKNRLLNYIYHRLDTFCVIWSDVVWNVSERMIEGREKKGVSTKYRTKQATVPIGINYSMIKRPSYTQIDRKKVIFLGHLIEKQGVQLLIQAAPMIISEVPDIRFEIIGGGEYENDLKRLAEDLGVQKYFEFEGLITDRDIIEQKLRKAAIGVAPYVPFSDNFTYYSDPTKPKDYMAFGLPVIITDVPHIAKEIEERKVGFIIKYDSNMLAEKVLTLLKDDGLYQLYRQNAIEFASEYDWNKIFPRAFQTV